MLNPSNQTNYYLIIEDPTLYLQWEESVSLSQGDYNLDYNADFSLFKIN